MSKEKGKYRAKWREDTWLARHVDSGGTLSLRGTVGVTKGGVRRLENLTKHMFTGNPSKQLGDVIICMKLLFVIHILRL